MIGWPRALGSPIKIAILGSLISICASAWYLSANSAIKFSAARRVVSIFRYACKGFFLFSGYLKGGICFRDQPARPCDYWSEQGIFEF